MAVSLLVGETFGNDPIDRTTEGPTMPVMTTTCEISETSAELRFLDPHGLADPHRLARAARTATDSRRYGHQEDQS